MPEFKDQKRLPGYLIQLLQKQTKEFYSYTKPITCGWIGSKHCSAQIICLTSVWFLYFGQRPWWKIRCHMDHPGYLWRNIQAAFHFELNFFVFYTFIFADLAAFWFPKMIHALSEETRRLAAYSWRLMMMTASSGLSRLGLDFLTQRKSKDCRMADWPMVQTFPFQVLQDNACS